MKHLSRLLYVTLVLILCHNLCIFANKTRLDIESINVRLDELQTENEPNSDVIPPTQNETIRTYEVDYNLYDIELDEELQTYTQVVAKSYGLNPLIVLAVMQKESRYDTGAISSGGGNVGLMQINSVNHEWLKEDLHITDIQEPHNNILCGCHILSMLQSKYGNINKVLMAYNCGEGTAQTLWSQGIKTSHYTETVLKYAEEIKASETGQKTHTN